MLGEVVRASYLRRSMWKGYAREDVDRLLARVAADLDAGRSPRRALEDATLPTVWGGYAVEDVDWLVDRLRAAPTAPGDSATALVGHRSDWRRALATRVVGILAAATLVGAVLGAGALATLAAVTLVAYVPFGARRSYRALVFRVRVDPTIRTRFYVSSIVLKWTYVAVIAIVGAFARRGAAAIGLSLGHASPTARAIGVSVVVVAISATVPSFLRLRRALPGSLPTVRRQLQGAIALLPRTHRERRIFVATAITAGVTEEILYRGFGIAFLRWWQPGISALAIVAITAVCFGLAHLYQGRRGVVLTGAVGALLAWLTLSSGSLIPAIVLHTVLDLRLVAIPRWLLDEELQPSPR